MSKNRHIINLNIFVVNVENPDETVNYLAERAQEISRAVLERAQREVVEPEEEDDISSSSDDESSSGSDSDGWGTEFEELVYEAEQARNHMYELRTYAAEKQKAFLDAKEEAEKAEKEMKEAEEEFKHKSDYAVKCCEEIKQEKLAKKKAKLNDN